MVIILLSLTSNPECLNGKINGTKKIEKPLGLVNLDGVCYANATLESLFHLNDFNNFLIARRKSIAKKPNSPSLQAYLKALKAYRRNSANPIFYSFIQGSYKPSVKLGTYKGIVNERNEPTEIIQKILLEIQEISPSTNKLFNLLPPVQLKEIVKNKDLQATTKLLLRTSISKYVFIMIDNPFASKLYELVEIHSKSEGGLLLPTTIRISQNASYKLASIVSSSNLSQSEPLEAEGNDFQANHQGPNHSTAYTNIEGQWFYFNDQEVRRVNTSHIHSLLKGEPCLIDSKNMLVEQFAPGILIYERKNI